MENKLPFYRHPVAAFCFLLLPLLVALLSANFGLYPLEKSLMSALFTSAVMLWMTEAIPLPVTGFCIPVLAVVYGIAEPKSAFASFGEDIIFLFIGAFLLAEAMRKHHWDRRMAFWVLSFPFASVSLKRLFFVVGSLAFVLSMWISNTAATAMLFPIVLGICDALGTQLKNKQHLDRIRIGFLLAIAYSTSIGGITTPIGTPPNIITIGFLQERGFHFSFLQWIQATAPISITSFILMMTLLGATYGIGKATSFDGTQLRELCKQELKRLGSIKRAELQVVICFSVVVLLWILPGFLDKQTPSGHFFRNHLPMHVVGLAGGILFFFLPTGEGNRRNLDWGDAKHIDWGTVMLFGGGLTLGALLESTGLAGDLGAFILSTFGSSSLMLVVTSTIAAIFLTEVASNTASASIFVSVLLGTISANATTAAYSPIIAVCLATSYSFMLPVATPPNAIIFGSGHIPIKSMMRTGFLLNCIGIVVVVLFVEYLGFGAMLLSPR